MKQYINETKRMQFLAGIINESQINEIEGDITPEQAIQKAMPIVTKIEKLMLTFAKKGEQLLEADETNKLKGYLAKSPLSSELQSKLLMVIGAAAPLAAGVLAANPVVMGAAVGYMLFAFGKALYDETR